eukprot:2723856-Alexandrium_andersonii.AAC.1
MNGMLTEAGRDNERLAENNGMEAKQNEVEGAVNLIMSKVYQDLGDVANPIMMKEDQAARGVGAFPTHHGGKP